MAQSAKDRKARQRARDAEALNKFALFFDKMSESWEWDTDIPRFDNWQDMLEWIRDEFGKDETK